MSRVTDHILTDGWKGGRLEVANVRWSSTICRTLTSVSIEFGIPDDETRDLSGGNIV